MNEEAKNVFRPEPMPLLRTTRNLGNYLVRDKMDPMERKTGSCKWKIDR